MAPFEALLGFLDRLSPAATHESKLAPPLKSSLRKPVESLAPGTVQPVVTKKTVRMSLPAPVRDTRRYHDFDYRQTRGVPPFDASSIGQSIAAGYSSPPAPPPATNGYNHTFRAKFTGPGDGETGAEFRKMLGRRAVGRGGLGMVVDMSEGVPVYRWQDTTAPPPATVISRQPSVEETAPLMHPGTALDVARQTAITGRSASTVSLLSGSRGQAPVTISPPKHVGTTRRSTIQVHSPVASWVDEVTRVTSAPQQVSPMVQQSSRTPFVRVMVNKAPNRNSPPVMRKTITPMSSASQVRVAAPPSLTTRRPVSSKAPSLTAPSASSSSSSASWSTTPSMHIPPDAIHGKVTRTEVFDSPYAPRARQPPRTTYNSRETPLLHPGLQAGHFLPPRSHSGFAPFPPFPPFPQFPAFPAFPPFPSFPAFPQVSFLLSCDTSV